MFPFAEQHSCSIDLNSRNWPSIGLEWYQNDIRKYALLWLEDGRKNTYTFWICASHDNKWKNKFVFQNMRYDTVLVALPAMLDEAFELLSKWDIEVLR
jgi:hypothetical protein